MDISLHNLKLKGIIFESHSKPRGKKEKSTNLINFKDFTTDNFFKILGFRLPFCCYVNYVCEQRFDVSVRKALKTRIGIFRGEKKSRKVF